MPFTLNWAVYVVASRDPGTFTVNGGSSANIYELDIVCYHFCGNDGTSGEPWMIFLSDCLGNPLKLMKIQ